MYSKPPGRRMVTSDIHNFFVISFHGLNISYYFPFLVRVLFGHLSFWVIFILIEFMKQCLFLSLSILNISTLIQTSFILNHNWVHIHEDKVCSNVLWLLQFSFVSGNNRVFPNDVGLSSNCHWFDWIYFGQYFSAWKFLNLNISLEARRIHAYIIQWYIWEIEKF